MEVTVEFIDRKGFWHIKRAKSKKLLMQWFAQLHKATEIHWTKKNHCVVSQQYCQAK